MDNENVVQSTQASKKPQLPPIVRYALMAVIAFVALSLVISILTALIPDKFEVNDGNSISWNVNDDDQLVFLFNGKDIVELDDEISKKVEIQSVSRDYHAEYAYFTTKSEVDEEKGTVNYGDLYVVDDKEAVKVADEVSNYRVGPFGDVLYYLSDGDLFTVKLKNAEKSTKIATDVDYLLTTSPDGDSVVYAKIDSEGEKAKTEYYVSVDGDKGQKFGKKDAAIVAISNDAELVYYTKDNKFYVNDTKLADSDKMSTSSLYFNRDGSQVLLTVANKDGDKKVYLSVKEKGKNAVADGEISGFVTPAGATRYSYSTITLCYANTSSLKKMAIEVNEYDKDDGKSDTYYYYLKNTKGKSEKISAMKNASDVFMLDDGKTVYYLKSDNLRTLNVRKPDSEPTEYRGADEDIKDFDCSLTGEYIYVRDVDNTLYYVKNEDKMVKVADDVVSYRTLEDGKVYLLNEDDELGYADRSDKVKRVASDVDSISYNARADVATAEVDDSYGVLKGKKYKKLYAID